METTENPTNGANKAQQTAHVSIDEWILKMRIAFTNAKLPGIYEVMLEVGYTNEKIDDCMSKLEKSIYLCRIILFNLLCYQLIVRVAPRNSR